MCYTSSSRHGGTSIGIQNLHFKHKGVYTFIAMARLFGLISKNSVNFSLSIPSAQSGTMPKVHGWGIGWYDNKGKIIVEKGKRSSFIPEENKEVEVVGQSNIIISHMRVASSGSVNEKNAHPFFYKKYLFAHNGMIHKEKISSLLKNPFNADFQSEPIDSEIFFRFIVQSIQEEKDVTAGVKKAVVEARDERGTNFILSDGEKIYAYRFGLPLYFLRRRPSALVVKSQETEAVFSCKDFSLQNSFLVSSEKSTEENWIAFDDNELAVCDKTLNYQTLRV